MYENYFLLKIAGNEQKFQNHQSKTEKRFGEYWIWAFDFHVFVIEFHHIQIFQIDTFSYFFYFFLCISSEFWWIGWKIQQSRLQYQITHCIVLSQDSCVCTTILLTGFDFIELFVSHPNENHSSFWLNHRTQ